MKPKTTSGPHRGCRCTSRGNRQRGDRGNQAEDREEKVMHRAAVEAVEHVSQLHPVELYFFQWPR